MSSTTVGTRHLIKRVALLGATRGLLLAPLAGTASAKTQAPAQHVAAVAAPVAQNSALKSALKGLTPVSPAALQRILAGTSGHITPNLGFNGLYTHIVNDNRKQCLAVPGGSQNGGTGLIQWPCGGWPDRYWH